VRACQASRTILPRFHSARYLAPRSAPPGRPTTRWSPLRFASRPWRPAPIPAPLRVHHGCAPKGVEGEASPSGPAPPWHRPPLSCREIRGQCRCTGAARRGERPERPGIFDRPGQPGVGVGAILAACRPRLPHRGAPQISGPLGRSEASHAQRALASSIGGLFRRCL